VHSRIQRLRFSSLALALLALFGPWDNFARAALHPGKYTGTLQYIESQSDLVLELTGEPEHMQVQITSGPPLNLKGEAVGHAVLCRMQGTSTKGEKLELVGNCWGEQYSGALIVLDQNGKQRRGKFETQREDQSTSGPKPPDTTRVTGGSTAKPSSAVAELGRAATSTSKGHTSVKSAGTNATPQSAGTHSRHTRKRRY
jgi:hypothetical protein